MVCNADYFFRRISLINAHYLKVYDYMLTLPDEVLVSSNSTSLLYIFCPDTSHLAMGMESGKDIIHCDALPRHFRSTRISSLCVTVPTHWLLETKKSSVVWFNRDFTADVSSTHLVILNP